MKWIYFPSQEVHKSSFVKVRCYQAQGLGLFLVKKSQANLENTLNTLKPATHQPTNISNVPGDFRRQLNIVQLLFPLLH